MFTHFFWDHGSDHGVCDHDLKKEIKVIAKLLSLFSAIIFDMKVLAILQL